MPNYRISEQAKSDLQHIYRHGVREYGERQADRYFDAFLYRIAQIAAQPELYQAVDEIREGYRRSVCGADSIYYRVVNGTVEIMRILGRQDTNECL